MKITDVHTHGIGGFDTRTGFVDHVLRIAAIQGSYGVSRILPAIYPATIKVMRENMGIVKEAMKLQREGHFVGDSGRIPPCTVFEDGNECGSEDTGKEGGACKPAEIGGVHLEGPFLNPSRCGALNAMTFLDPTEHNFRELVEGYDDIVRIITIAPELDGALGLIRTASDSGIIVSMGHSDATYAEAEAGCGAGARGITHIFNAMRGFHQREPGIAGFGLLDRDVYIEVIADPFHLHAKIIELIFKTKNPDKIMIVSDAVKEAKTGTDGDSGITDAYGKLLGGSMTVLESARSLISAGYDEGVIMKCVTENPDAYLSR